MSTPPRKGLTLRETAFLHHYLGNCDCPDPACQFNGLRSWRRGSPTCHSDKSAGAQASRALARPRVQRAIDTAFRKSGLEPDRIKLELVRIATLDPAKLFTPDGKLRDIVDLDPNVRAAISHLEITQTRDKNGKVTTHLSKIRLHNKPEALRLAANILDLVKQRHVHEGRIPLALVDAAVADAEEELEDETQL